MVSLVLSFLFQALSASAWLQPDGGVDVNTPPAQPQSDICGQVVNANLYAGQVWYYASDIISCLTSVEFLPAVATRFLNYYNENVQFQTTLAYLKNPPTGYQQPAVDLLAALQQVQDNVNSNVYQNQYTFEADLQAIITASHDGHFTLYAGVLNQFTFGSPYDIVSVSKDGKAPPEIYLYNDLYECYRASSCNATAISSINGVPVNDYLTAFASNQSFGLLEPHADWNQLIRTPALEIQQGLSIFGGAANLYPGDNLTFGYANGTTLSTQWLSLYSSPGYTGPLETGGDFYNFFVLGLLPASYNYTAYLDIIQPPSSSTNFTPSSNTSGPQYLTSWNSISSAYPANTLSHQKLLGPDSSGVITSYLLPDINTGVISVPTFAEYGNGINTFSSAISAFINKAANADHIIIDLQQNSGGQVSLAFGMFEQFFPNAVPFSGSRMRAQSMADALGNTFTNAYDETAVNSDNYTDLLGSEWVVTDRINAQTGQNFTSWAQYYGPLAENGDFFTLIQQYNLSSSAFDASDFGVNFGPGAFNLSAPKLQTPWQPEDIVIMGGVRTVVVGGRPEQGPMQAVSGTRGAADYSDADLNDDIDQAIGYNATAQNDLPVRGNATDSGMFINYLGFNLRDQMRQNASTPNQFLYLPATCRIYWTFANWYNYTQLWTDTWNAIYNDSSICVPGSVNATSTNPSVINSTAVLSQAVAAVAADPLAHLSEHILQGIQALPNADGTNDGVLDSDRPVPNANKLVNCRNPRTGRKDDSLCVSSSCVEVPTDCNACKVVRGVSRCGFSGSVNRFLCLPSCATTSQQGNNCGSGTSCQSSKQQNTVLNSAVQFNDPGDLVPEGNFFGLCYPDPPSTLPSCRSLEEKKEPRPKSGGGQPEKETPPTVEPDVPIERIHIRKSRFRR